MCAWGERLAGLAALFRLDDDFVLPPLFFQRCQGDLVAILDMAIAHIIHGGEANAACHSAAYEGYELRYPFGGDPDAHFL